MILAGGRGLRMRHYDSRVPKALLRVAEEPFAHWQLTWLAAEGVSRVLYCTGYLGEMVQRYVGDGSQWGIAVSYSDEGDRRLGTAGALRLAYDKGLLEREFSILYGDSYLQLSVRQLEEAFAGCPEPAVMAVLRNDGRWDASNVVLSDGLITLYAKGLVNLPAGMHWIDYGMSVLDRELIDRLIPPDVGSDLSSVFTTLSRSGQLRGFEVSERFFEVGSPDGLHELDSHLRERSPGIRGHYGASESGSSGPEKQGSIEI